MVSPVTATLELPPPADGSAAPRADEAAIAELSFEAIYEEHLAFVWRSLRRLGGREALVDDAGQEGCRVARRRLPWFEGRSSVEPWIYGVVLRVARLCRRNAQRHPEAEGAPVGAGEGAAACSGPLPDESAERSEAV